MFSLQTGACFSREGWRGWTVLQPVSFQRGTNNDGRINMSDFTGKENTTEWLIYAENNQTALWKHVKKKKKTRTTLRNPTKSLRWRPIKLFPDLMPVTGKHAVTKLILHSTQIKWQRWYLCERRRSTTIKANVEIDELFLSYLSTIGLNIRISQLILQRM